MGHATCDMDSFITLHREQLTTAAVPEKYWSTLQNKLKGEVFDAGSFFQIVKLDYEGNREERDPSYALQALQDINLSDKEHIYLIDHCWTFQVNKAKQNLREHESLCSRLANILNIDENKPKEELIQEIYDNVWRISGTYSVANIEAGDGQSPVWYIMDEVGSAVNHSDHPNCRIVPFIYINDVITYSILFPITDMESGDIITRDFSNCSFEDPKRPAILLPWVNSSFEHVDIDPPILGKEYFLSGHIEESLPNLSNFSDKNIVKKAKYKVFSEYSMVNKYLTNNRFEIIDNEENADIIWYLNHFKDFKTLSETPYKFINQFPFEFVITVKDLLSIVTCRIKNNWRPITYNLNNEISHFISYFQKLENEGVIDNYWICKPYNLARGLDMVITNNLNCLIRMRETGPKIVQKYITKPVLYYRTDLACKVKFDIRYVLLLKSVKPLQVYIYKNFFLRFANKPFELNDFDVYEKHFTVMNYQENTNLSKLLAHEFKINFEQQNNSFLWNDVEKNILKMFKEIFECAVMQKPPCGIAESPQSRALYAADIMLEWNENNEMQPKLLEINFAPDCKRACEYYPDFYNDIFSLLFLDKEKDASFFKL